MKTSHIAFVLMLVFLPGCKSCDNRDARVIDTGDRKATVRTASAEAHETVRNAVVPTTQAAERAKDHIHNAQEGVQDMAEKHNDPEINEAISPHLAGAEIEIDKINEIQTVFATEAPKAITKVETAGSKTIDTQAKTIEKLEGKIAEYEKGIAQDNARKISLLAIALLVGAIFGTVGAVVAHQWLGPVIGKSIGAGAAVAGVAAFACFTYAEHKWWLNVVGAIIIVAIMVSVGVVAIMAVRKWSRSFTDLVGKTDTVIKPILEEKAPDVAIKIFGNNAPEGTAAHVAGEMQASLEDSTQAMVRVVRDPVEMHRGLREVPVEAEEDMIVGDDVPVPGVKARTASSVALPLVRVAA